MRSRVIPGSSPTSARREPTSRLKSVLLPTLGRPTMAIVGRACSSTAEDRIRARFAIAVAKLPHAIGCACEVLLERSLPPMSTTPKPAPAAASWTLYQFFAPGGMLSKTHPAYEFRRGQLQMAQAVEQALEEKRHLIVEAGTGTGKTLAYLVPVIRSGKRVVISTGTKNLQEQLFFKDVPFLEQHLFGGNPGKLRVCYMKGRNNYLCRQKLYDLTNQPVLNGLQEIDQYRQIAEW